MRTHWELKGNIVGTQWEPGKNEKKMLPLLPLLMKRLYMGLPKDYLGVKLGATKGPI